MWQLNYVLYVCNVGVIDQVSIHSVVTFVFFVDWQIKKLIFMFSTLFKCNYWIFTFNDHVSMFFMLMNLFYIAVFASVESFGWCFNCLFTMANRKQYNWRPMSFVMMCHHSSWFVKCFNAMGLPWRHFMTTSNCVCSKFFSGIYSFSLFMHFVFTYSWMWTGQCAPL